MNCIPTKFRSLALLAAVATAALGAGCGSGKTGSQASLASGKANVGVKVNALQATQIAKMTLTISTDTTSGPPSFNPITTNLTNNDLTKSLNWSAFVQGVPAGTQRLFTIQAFDGSNAVVYSGSARADITAGNTANVYIVLQGLNDGGFQNSLPVVDALSSSANLVVVGTTPAPAPVALTFTAHDPDAAATLTYAWADSCGSSFDSASGPLAQSTATTVHWTAPTTVPTSGACTLTLKITDNKQGTVTAYLAIQIQANTNGNAVVNAYPNSWPMIQGLVVEETFAKNTAGQIVSVEYDLTATVIDNDGDDVKYTWSIDATKGCNKAGDGYTASVPAVTTPTTTLAYGQGQIGSSTVHYHTTDLGNACVFKLDVTDYWKNGIVPVGSGLPVARGGDTLGVINGSVAKDFAIAPAITKWAAPNAPSQSTPNSAHYIAAADQTVQLDIEVLDNTPSFNPPGTPFTYAWTQSGGAFAGTESDVTTSPGKSTYQWKAAHSYAPNSQVTVTVTNAQGLSASYTWYFDPANPCDGTAATVGLACNTGLGLCAPAGKCTAAGTCVDPNAVVCAAPTQCQQAGVCQPSTGTCTFAPQTAGTACNADSNGCTFNDVCDGAGTCNAGSAVVCNTPADAQCQSATGVCQSTGNNTYSCNYTNAVNGTACNKDNNGCTQNDSCQAGVCTAGAAVVCTNSSNPCQGATGTCASSGANSFNCNYSNLTDGTACNTGGVCNAGQTCVAGNCQGGSSACPAGTNCVANGTSFTCPGTIVAPQVAKDLPISGPAGLSIDTAGKSYVAAGIYGGPFTLDGHSVSSSGDADIVVAQYDATGVAQWAVTYGEATNPQFAVGSAVTADGTVAIIGSFAGTFSIGPSSLSNASPIDFLAGLSSVDGSGKFAKQFDNGANGTLKAVAANANDSSATHGNRIAVCGLTAGNTVNPGLITATGGVNIGGAIAAGNDIIIGAFKSDGTKLWAAQYSSAGTFNDECDAVAVDDNGDVWATGSTSGATLNFGGATSALTGPGASTRKYVWVAKFNGQTGAAISSAIFAGTGQAVPGVASIAIDATGNVALAGQFTGSATFGGTTLTSAGLADAWAAKLNSTLAPIWAVRLGGAGGDVANGVAVTYYGDVVVTGLINKGPTTGAAALTAASTTAPDAFILKLNGNTGATDFAANYGDAANQSGDAIAINKYSAVDQIAVVGSITASMTFPAPAGSITSVNPTDVWFLTAKLQ